MLNKILIGVAIFVIIYFMQMSIKIDILESDNAVLKESADVVEYETTNKIIKEVTDEKIKYIIDSNDTINDGTYRL